MIYKYNKSLVGNARTLRKNMTKGEKHLWYDFLKKLPFTVNRQKNLGDFIVDFFISKKRVVIEIDGAQHFEPTNREADKQRDDELFKLGITVLRYSNYEISKNFEAVCNDILNRLSLKTSDLFFKD